MSEAPTPKPGTVAAFKQRHEAYALTRNGPDVIDASRSSLYDGFARAASADVGDWLKALEKNPEAQRMVKARAPGLIKEAQGLKAEADQLAREEARFRVTTTDRGEWRMGMDGGTEARLSFGKSQEGHHYRLETATYNSERDGGWTAPFRTEEAARAAGYAAVGNALGEQMPRPRDDVRQTSRGRHAELLNNAAQSRLAVARGWAARPGSPHHAEVTSRHKAAAREAVSRATTVRQFSMEGPVMSAFSTRTPEMRAEQQRSQGVERGQSQSQSRGMGRTQARGPEPRRDRGQERER